jgi:hypothetical protein
MFQLGTYKKMNEWMISQDNLAPMPGNSNNPDILTTTYHY